MIWRCLMGGLVLAGLGMIQAHEVTLEWEVVDGTLAIQGMVGGEAAAGAAVEIRLERGRVVEAGKMDEAGRFEWRIVERGPITVVLRDGLGHRRTVTLSDAELRGAVRGGAGGGHGEIGQGMRVVLGLTFLLVLASAWMSYGNRRRIAMLERRLQGEHES
jgi:hypothetical protein